MPEKQYDHNQIELKWHERWKNDRIPLPPRRTPSKPKYLRARDAALPERHAAHRPRPQLRDRRRAGALQVDARLQRAAPDGLGRLRPAGRERRDQEQPASARVDAAEHRGDEAPAPAHGLQLRLGSAKSPPASPSITAGTSGSSCKMLERGLAYRKKALVNWCPECATVLANEQVVDGCCWRHETTPVEQRALEQWFLQDHRLCRRTAARTSTKLEGGWPERVLHDAAQLDRPQRGRRGRFHARRHGRDDPRLHHARGHHLRRHLRDPGARASADAATARCRRSTGRARRRWSMRSARKDPGRHREGRHSSPATTPSIRTAARRCRSGSANFVLMGYGTGAIMAVPAHDERDFEFCTKYGIPIRPVIRPVDGALAAASRMKEAVRRLRHRRELRRVVRAAERRSAAEDERSMPRSKGFGKAAITYRIKDWGISRQRYWGTPIPVIHCPNAAWCRCPTISFRWCLPTERRDHGQGPLARSSRVPEFVNVKCPKCGGDARRETDTMDTFVDSSWYFYRYCDRAQRQGAVRFEEDRLLVPDRPVHRRRRARHPAPDLLALLHQGDARPRADHERRAGGAPVHAGHGDQGRREDVEDQGQRRQRRRHGRRSTAPTPAACSCCSPRLRKRSWTGRDAGAEGSYRFLGRVYRFVTRNIGPRERSATPTDRRPTRMSCASCTRRSRRSPRTSRRAGTSTPRSRRSWNWSTSCTRTRRSCPRRRCGKTLEKLVLMLAPFAPYIDAGDVGPAGPQRSWCSGSRGRSTTRNWRGRTGAEVVRAGQRQAARPDAGAVRHPQEELERLALADEKVQPFLDGKQVVKVIVVPDKLVNIVVK